jgi:hypothetical protein
MAHENDSFIREVNEQLRSEQMHKFWKKWRVAIIGAAALVVVGSAGAGIYEYWTTHKANASGDQFSAALKLVEEGKNDEALVAFAALETEGHGSYPVLAKFRAASVQAEKGDVAGAVAAFTAIGNDRSTAEVFRDTAKLRAGWLQVDTATYDEVSAVVEVLSSDTHAMRSSAREVLGLSAYKNGDFIKAKQWFELIASDAQAPRNVSSRIQILLDNIAASGKAN